MKRDKDSSRTIEFFTQKLAQHGWGHKAVNWGSADGQMLRFKVLTEVGDLNGRSVLDVGCGCGQFVEYLTGQGISIEYIGCDITPAMIESAGQKFPNRRFEVRDILAEAASREPQVDYVVASGIFYLRQTDPHDYLKDMVARMFALARKAVAFNTLSILATDIDEREFYADPARVLADCLDITSSVTLRHDYMPHDFTVYLYRENEL